MMSLALLILVLTSWVAFVLPDSSLTNATAAWVTTGGIILGFVCLIIYCCRQTPRWRFLLLATIGAVLGSYLRARCEMLPSGVPKFLEPPIAHHFTATIACHAAFAGFFWASLGVLAAMALQKDRNERLIPIGLAAFGGLLIGRTWQLLFIPLNDIAGQWGSESLMQAAWLGMMIGLDLWQLPYRIESPRKRVVIAAVAIVIVLAGAEISRIDSVGQGNTYTARSFIWQPFNNALLQKLQFGNVWVKSVGGGLQSLICPSARGGESALSQYQEDEFSDAAFAMSNGDIHKAVPRIARLTAKPDDISHRALGVLAENGDISAVAPLLRLLRDTELEPTVRGQVASALGHLAGSATGHAESPRFLDHGLYRYQNKAQVASSCVQIQQALTATLNDSSRDVRIGAIDGLAVVGGDAAVTEFARAANDGDPAIRQAAIAGLHTVDAKKAAPLLIRALRDSDSGVRVEAVYTLVERPSKSAIPALGKVLRDKDSVAAMNAAKALSRTRDKSVIPILEATRDSMVRAQPAKYRKNTRRNLDKLIQDVRENKPLSDPDMW